MTNNHNNHAQANKTTTHIDEHNHKIITEYNATNQKITTTRYNPNGTLRSINDHDPQTGQIIKSTEYWSDGSLWLIAHNNPQTGNRTKTIFYDEGRIEEIIKYDIQGNPTTYYPDGSLKEIEERDPITNNSIKEIKFNPDKTIKTITIFNPDETNSVAYYNPDGSLDSIEDYNPSTTNYLRTHFPSDLTSEEIKTTEQTYKDTRQKYQSLPSNK
ncbi:DUF2963 domain-containing protein [Candidatus Phytoplasma pruni]|uniref:DUF2963 domain-containing protein n=1 Tax=Candidatus Phytoplasma pruni TaxID=479893 RepID=A0A851HGJ8_9MOLU|nr:hypothetical protein [Candidatus Phytoplasma pruni]NWN45760.1 hypothetical protein [Candidatus Phytoplasma pruni]